MMNAVKSLITLSTEEKEALKQILSLNEKLLNKKLLSLTGFIVAFLPLLAIGVLEVLKIIEPVDLRFFPAMLLTWIIGGVLLSLFIYFYALRTSRMRINKEFDEIPFSPSGKTLFQKLLLLEAQLNNLDDSVKKVIHLGESGLPSLPVNIHTAARALGLN